MARESVGTVRIHSWTCDNCNTVVENRSKASGSIPMPEGWAKIRVQIDSAESSADICSGACARDFMDNVLETFAVPDPREGDAARLHEAPAAKAAREAIASSSGGSSR